MSDIDVPLHIAAQLMRDEIDIAPAEFTITSMRSEVVDFNMPIAESHQKFFVKNPSEAPNWTAFFDPLSDRCWLVIFSFIAIVPFFLTLATTLCKVNWNFLLLHMQCKTFLPL